MADCVVYISSNTKYKEALQECFLNCGLPFVCVKTPERAQKLLESGEAVYLLVDEETASRGIIELVRQVEQGKVPIGVLTFGADPSFLARLINEFGVAHIFTNPSDAKSVFRKIYTYYASVQESNDDALCEQISKREAELLSVLNHQKDALRKQQNSYYKLQTLFDSVLNCSDAHALRTIEERAMLRRWFDFYLRVHTTTKDDSVEDGIVNDLTNIQLRYPGLRISSVNNCFVEGTSGMNIANVRFIIVMIAEYACLLCGACSFSVDSCLLTGVRARFHIEAEFDQRVEQNNRELFDFIQEIVSCITETAELAMQEDGLACQIEFSTVS